MSKIWMVALAMAAMVLTVTPAGAFIGAGINLNKHLGDTVHFGLKPTLVQAAGAAYGLATQDLDVTWGVNYDLNALGGYPYGYGGVGAITDGDIGYSLGLSMDETHGAGFDGSAFGIPMAEGSMSSTKYDNLFAKNDHFQDEQVALPFG